MTKILHILQSIRGTHYNIPVVRATGGLDDTIVPYDDKTKKGNGFKFSTYGTVAFLGAIRQALDLYTDSDAWKDLITNNMKEDFSWDRSARSYLELYCSVVNG